MEIYRPTKRQGKYPPLVTDSEMKSCLKYQKTQRGNLAKKGDFTQLFLQR